MARISTPLPNVASPSRPPSRQQSEGAESSHSASIAATKAQKIPRPKNPWIIYRAHQMKLMQSEGRPKMPQAAVSKIIAERWKHEPQEVRNHYDYLAECDKAEHKMKYPDYSFRPEKRESKLRRKQEEREEKRREKQEARRAKTRDRSVSASNPLTSTNHVPYYPPFPHSDMPPHIMPSPLLAYAATPEPSPQPEGSTPVQVSTPASLSQELSAGPSDNQTSFMSFDMPMPQQGSSSFAASSLDWSALVELAQSVSDPSSIPAPTMSWSSELCSPSGEQNASDEHMIGFDMSGVPPSSWDGNPSDALSAMLSGTSAPSIYALSGLEGDAFSNPPSNIHVSIGSYPALPPEEVQSQYQDFAALLSSFDFTNLEMPEGAPEISSDSVENRSRSMDDVMMEQYLNEDMLSLSETRCQPPHTTSAPTVPTSPQKSYAPPAGASNTGTRRVAGSWRLPADLHMPDSPMVAPAPEPWRISAS